MTPQTLFAFILNTLLLKINLLLQILYALRIRTFAQYYYIPFVEKWLSIFIHDCIECQRNKHFNMKIQTAPTQSFQNMLHLLTIAFQWTLKDLLILLPTKNHIYM